MNKVILMSNLGYLRGINGCLADHMRYAHRHFYCAPKVREASEAMLTDIIQQEQPDLCCFVEIEHAPGSAVNPLRSLGGHYPFFDVENKYGPASRLRTMPGMRGKSNGFLAKEKMPYEKIFFTHGTKRLIYKIQIAPDVSVFFAHFSLKKAVRMEQLKQIRELVAQTPGEIIVLGDFNIHTGFGELKPLLHDNHLVLLNREDEPTFTFHKKRLPLDLCICSQGIASRSELRIIPQPYSDHDALLLKISD
jgi:hypothetical protein